ncbi:SpoIIE family protein phosphatase [Candidatus Woesearchaeota archaeon]|nr:SpoIIE family protein phosphatase [Candidatus Woesearchaeota archaeon]
MPSGSFKLQKGDIVISSSDGFHDNVFDGPSGRLQAVINDAFRRGIKEPAKIRDMLVSEAQRASDARHFNKQPKGDDISIIVYVHEY